MNTFGGSKKQGVTSRIGLDNWANVAVQTYSNGYGRNKLFVMNQLGGVGAGKSMFNGRFIQTDGTHSEQNTQRDNIPPFLRFLCNSSTKNMLSYQDFERVALDYIIQNPNIPGDKSMDELKKEFFLCMVFFGIKGKISKYKILNYDFDNHSEHVRNLNILRYGPPVGSSSSSGSCDCPPDYSGSGKGCACSSWSGCWGWCHGDSCDFSSIPWWC